MMRQFLSLAVVMAVLAFSGVVYAIHPIADVIVTNADNTQTITKRVHNANATYTTTVEQWSVPAATTPFARTLVSSTTTTAPAAGSIQADTAGIAQVKETLIAWAGAFFVLLLVVLGYRRVRVVVR